MRRLVVLCGALAGVAVAAVVTFLLVEPTYRADATVVLVRQGQPPGSDARLEEAAGAAAALFESRGVAESVVANLRLDESPQELLDRVEIDAEPETSLVRVEVDAPSREEARRRAQALTEVATVLYNNRFGPETTASVWEAARTQDDAVAPDVARSLALGALAGAVLASLALALGLRLPERVPRPTGKRASDTVSQALPAAAPRETPAPEPFVPAAPAEPASDTVSQAPPAPAPPPAADPGPAGPFVEPRVGEWTVRDVELLLAEQGPAFPERVEELRMYLDSFRDVAGPGGELPDGVEGIVEDVFRDLLDRARLASPA